MAAGARQVVDRDLEIVLRPLADGGNGLLNALEASGGGKGRAARVAGPLGTSVTARFLVQERRVVVETAEACGMHLVPQPLLDPLRTSTRGVGELLLAAAERVEDLDGRGRGDPSDRASTPDDSGRSSAPGSGARLVVGLGGSATVDGGAGMLSALGWRLLDDDGEPIPPGGAGLLRLTHVEPPDPPPSLLEMVVLADVTNPLLGALGAAQVFAPQKGATEAGVARLERALEQWHRVVWKELGQDVADLPGAGAAGGLGAAFAAFLDTPPAPGAGWILDEAGFDRALERAAVVITGEGCWDEQSSMGKVTGEVVRRSQRAGVPVLMAAGRVGSALPDGVVAATERGGAAEFDRAEGGGRTEGGGPGAPGRERPKDAVDADAEMLARRVAATLPGLLARTRRS